MQNGPMYKWSIQQVRLPLKFTWKISKGESSEKSLFFVKVEDGARSGMGEVAGITTDKQQFANLIEQFNDFADDHVSDIAEIRNYDLPPHLEFGISSALTHLEAEKKGHSLSRHLGVQPSLPITTSFSLPILPPDQTLDFFYKYNLDQYSVLKIKVSQDNPVQSCLQLAEVYKGPIRIDANEAFQTHNEVLDFIGQLKGIDIQFVEQPMPRQKKKEYLKLKVASPVPVLADESLQNQVLDEEFRELFHGINVKLMKAGSYQRALQQIRQAKAWDMQVMLGCMVESSLGIAGAMAISQDVDYFDLDGFLYFKNEPHNLVTENKGQLTYRQNPLFSVD